MGYDVTEENFQIEVIEKSNSIPVLVDFWAEWCGPCRMLGPVLEKAANTRKDFVLVKIDTDKNQKIAAQYKINGIPDVKLFFKGEIIGEFTGALPEAMVNNFLDKNIPDPETKRLLQKSIENPIEAATEAIEKKKVGIKMSPIFWNACLALMQSKEEVEKIKTYLDLIPATGATHSSEALSIKQYLKKWEVIPEKISSLLKNTNDASQKNTMQDLLNEVSSVSSKENEQHKETMLLAFNLLGQKHPLVNEYRKKLASVLY